MVARLFRGFALILGVLALSGCMAPQIDDYSGRSVVYGWVDLSEAAGNRVTGAGLRAFNEPPNKNIYPMGSKKLGNGFLVYHYGVKPGPVKLGTVSAMSCIGLCGNVVNVYDFGAQGGDIAAARVNGQNAYFLGSYGLKTRRTLFFGPRDFEVNRVRGPSRKQMLEAILADAPEDQKPLIQRAISRL